MHRLASGLPAFIVALQRSIVKRARALEIEIVCRLGWRLEKVQHLQSSGAGDDMKSATCEPAAPRMRLTFAQVESDAGDDDVASVPWAENDPLAHLSSAPGAAAVPRGREWVDVTQATLIAVPPRLAATAIAYEPALDRACMSELLAQPIWMGATGKVALTYDTPWWRALPGHYDIHAMRVPGPGPVVQLMDASTHEDQAFVLVAFVAPERGTGNWREAAVAQIARLVQTLLNAENNPSSALPAPRAIHAKLWATDTNIFCPAPRGLSDFGHPEPLDPSAAVHYDGRLHFCASEMASVAPGYIEGAVHAGSLAARAAAALYQAAP